MTTRNRPVNMIGSLNSSATPARQQLLRLIISSLLPHSIISALFYAERLYSLDNSLESSVFLLGLVLKESGGREMEAIHVLRNNITFMPTSTGTEGDANGGGISHGGRRKNNGGVKAISRPAIECSIRCARLYADCCQTLGREKEGREVLAKVLQTGVPLVSTIDSVILPPTSFTSSNLSATTTTISNQSYYNSNESWVLELQLARLAQRAGEKERAIVFYRKVLEGNPWCWEAVEGLCKEGEPPNMDTLFPPRPLPNSSSSDLNVLVGGVGGPSSIKMTSNGSSNSNNTLTPIVPGGQPSSILQSANQYYTKPPLGPSQTSAVNSSFSFIKSRPNEGLGFFTPPELNGGSGMMMGGVGGKAKDKSLFSYGTAAGGGGGFKRNGRSGDIEMSIDDGSFESSFYPSPGYGSSNPPMFANAIASTSNANSLFTPPAPQFSTTSATTAAPGVKRARGGNTQVQSTSSNSILMDDDISLLPARRVVRKVPEKSTSSRRDTSLPPSASSSTTSSSTATATAGPPTRRSTRLSRDVSITSATSASMTLSRSQTSSHGATTSRNNNKKRSKAGAGPSVLSDGGSDALSPVSQSSSPAPSSPGLPSIPFPSIRSHHPSPLISIQSLQLPLVQLPLPLPTFTSVAASTIASTTSIDPQLILEAEEYLESVTKLFAKAEGYNALYQSTLALTTFSLLPLEQRTSPRTYLGMAKAQMELLQYNTASLSFQSFRASSPHSLLSMDLYSTLLWHLKDPIQLSFLAQELMTIDPKSSTSWIATGNVFSHLEDPSSALKCFRRATQLAQQFRVGGGDGGVYAMTLSGHECVVLEEWERALGFFRDAVRKDGRCYNAWFGLGNVYMQTGKYRLAEYHFRKAAELNPSNATLICCVGSVLERLGRRKEALELYEKACVLAPESAAVRFKRVRVLITLKQYSTAERDLLELIHLAPKEFNLHFTLGKLYKLMILDSTSNDEQDSNRKGREKAMLKSFALATDLEPRMSVVVREWISKGLDDDEDEEAGVSGGGGQQEEEGEEESGEGERMRE